MRKIERAIFRPWLLGVRIGLLKPAHNAITAETANDSCCWAAADEEAANDGAIIYYKVLIGGSGGAMEARRLVAAPFLVKTYRLVDDPSTDHIVSWGDNNDTFVVWDPKEFSASVLPSYFNHTNFSSFVRQLNTYGFRKILRRRCEYENKLFQKGEKHLLSLIQRRKSSTASLFRPISSTQDSIVPAAVASLSEENETLRRNNSSLLSDIAGLQNICSSDMSLNRSTWADSPLMINMHRSKIYRTDVAEDNSVSTPKLFGVPLY